MAKKVLVAVYSASGVTRRVGEEIARISGGDFFEIMPKEPYTSADLDWMNKKSRSSVEMNDPSARPEIVNAVPNMGDYDTVIIGFPIWWGVAPRIIETFLESYDFAGKTIAPFCTSGGSGVGRSDTALHKNVTVDVKWEKGVQINRPNETEMASGVPEAEIAFIHDADTEAKKKELFAKVRTGQVRVLLGSTQKMGAGTNVQNRLIAVHHLDVGWRPADMTQRNGRIIRQGNQNPEVKVFQYVTEGTFDAYLYQTLENKQKFISQIMTSKSPVRSCDDVDEQALSYAEIKALCAGNPLIREKMDLDVDVARLKVLKADHQSKQYRLEDKLLKYFPAEIERNKGYIAGFQRDLKTVEAHPLPKEDFAGMEVKGRRFTDKEAAGEAILAACKEYKGSDAAVPIGSYRGFAMELTYDSFRKDFEIILKGSMSHRATLGTDARGNITRLDNCLAAMPDRMQKVQDTLDNLYQQQAAAKEESGKPFPLEEELRKKSARLAELDAALNMDERDVPVAGEDLSDVAEVAEIKAAYGKPSVLAQLKEKMEQAAGEPHHNRPREAVAL